MKELVRNISLRASIAVIAVLLGIPCPVKKEIKQFLNLPLSETTTTQSKTDICTNVFTRHSAKTTAVSKKKKYTAALSQPVADAGRISTAENGHRNPYRKKIIHPIPIYILYERYLI